MPGLVVNRVAPGFLGDVLSSFPEGLVVVSGSSGKSTTTKMLVAILDARTASGSSRTPPRRTSARGSRPRCSSAPPLTGRIDADLAVLEMDEGHGALLSDRFRARLVLLTNVMTDQIDRFHDAEKVQAMLGRIAARASGAVVLNGDDALLARLAPDGARDALRRDRRGARRSRRAASGTPRPRRSGSTTARWSPRWPAGRRRSWCAATTLDVRLPAKGVHYAVDAAGALAAAEQLLGDGVRSRPSPPRRSPP